MKTGATTPAGKVLIQKGPANTGRRIAFFTSGTGGNITALVSRATTSTQYISNNTPASATNTWMFFAVTYNSTNSANNLLHLYSGTLTTAATEVTYGSQVDGSGALSSDSTAFVIGANLEFAGNEYPGRFAVVHLLNTDLSLNQIRAQQFKPHVISSSVGLWLLGSNGTGVTPDLSGHGNACTLTGGAAASGFPMGPLFGVNRITPSSIFAFLRAPFTY